MTLPQHLEPYMSGDTSHLARAFREAVFPGAKVTSSWFRIRISFRF